MQEGGAASDEDIVGKGLWSYVLVKRFFKDSLKKHCLTYLSRISLHMPAVSSYVRSDPLPLVEQKGKQSFKWRLMWKVKNAVCSSVILKSSELTLQSFKRKNVGWKLFSYFMFLQRQCKVRLKENIFLHGKPCYPLPYHANAVKDAVVLEGELWDAG